MKRQFFIKDGHVTAATSPAHAVQLAYDGWRDLGAGDFDPTPQPAESAPAVETPTEPTPPRKRTARN